MDATIGAQRTRPFSLALAVVAVLMAGLLALALIVTTTNHTGSAVPSVRIVHQQAPDAIDRNAEIRAAQAGGPQSDLTRAQPTAAPVDLNRNAERSGHREL